MHVVKRGRRTSPSGEIGTQYTLPVRSRLLTAARPMYNLLRAIIGTRPGPVRVIHVKAHSGRQDFAFLHNDLADSIANTARLASRDGAPLPLPLYGDVRYRLSLDGIPVIGPYRPALLRELRKRRLDTWSRKPRRGPAPPPSDASEGLYIQSPQVVHSARMVAANRSGVLDLCTVVQKCHNGALLRFWSLLLAEHLPTASRLSVTIV